MTDFWQSEYLLLGVDTLLPAVPTLHAGFDVLSDDGTYSVWIRKDLRSSTDCDQDQWPFRDFFQLPDDSLVCPRFPFTPPVVSDSLSLHFPDGQFIPVITSKARGNMKFDLLAKDTTPARILVRVDPKGYTVPHTLLLTLLPAGSPPLVYRAQFDAKTALRFDVLLAKGLYTAQIGLEAGAPEVRILGIKVTAP